MTTNSFFQVTVGNVVTWVALVASIIGFWWKMRFQLDSLDAKLKAQETTVKEFESKGVLLVLSQHEARLAKLETIFGTLAGMATDIALIKQWLEFEKRLSSDRKYADGTHS